MIDVLAITDRFAKRTIVELELERLLGVSGMRFAVSFLENDWPVESFQRSHEVQEFVGSDAVVARMAEDVDVILTHVGPVTERVFSEARRLRVVGVFRGGPVNVNIEAATRRGIPVVHAPGRNAPAVAEFTVGLVLAAFRRIPEAHKALINGIWRSDLYIFENSGLELDGRVAGIIGFGNVGARVSALLSGFGMHVLVNDPYVSREVVAASGAEPTDLDDLLKRSDVVSIHSRLTEGTRGLVNHSFLGKMKADAILVNTSRGGLVNHDDLVDALENGRLRGAALDVYGEEPLDNGSPLLHLKNVVLTPHIAGASQETAYRGVRQVISDVMAILKGERPQNCLNPKVL